MQFFGNDREGGQAAPRSLLSQVGSQWWAWLAVFIAGLLVGITVTVLFRPLIYALIIVALAVVVFRAVRFFQRGDRSSAEEGGPAIRGMVISGRYGEPGSGPVVQDRWQNAFDVPAAEPVERARPAANRPATASASSASAQGSAPTEDDDIPAPPRASDADIDAILARIDQQIASEGKAPGSRSARSGPTGTGEIIDAEVNDTSSRP